MQNCSRSIENYCFRHKNLVSFRGLCLLIPTGGSAPGPLLRAPPPDPHYGPELLRSPCVYY